MNYTTMYLNHSYWKTSRTISTQDFTPRTKRTIDLTDLGLGFSLDQGEEGDACEAFHTKDVTQRPSLGHNVT
jgi:hypothetical protein